MKRADPAGSLLHHWSPFSSPCWSPSPISRVVRRLRQCCSPPRRWWGRAMPHLDHQQPLRQFHPIDRWRVRQLHIQIRRRCGTDLRGAVPHRLRRRAGWVSVHRRMPSDDPFSDCTRDRLLLRLGYRSPTVQHTLYEPPFSRMGGVGSVSGAWPQDG